MKSAKARPDLFFDQVHMNPLGYEVVARAIAESLHRHLPIR